MTKQEVFDKVADHLMTQGKQARTTGKMKLFSFDEYEGCLYRTEDGLKCAAGCLIPDEEYNEALEGVKVQDVAVHYILQRVVGEDNLPLVMELQDIHDGVEPFEWETELNKLATKEGLNPWMPK